MANVEEQQKRHDIIELAEDADLALEEALVYAEGVEDRKILMAAHRSVLHAVGELHNR